MSNSEELRENSVRSWKSRTKFEKIREILENYNDARERLNKEYWKIPKN